MVVVDYADVCSCVSCLDSEFLDGYRKTTLLFFPPASTKTLPTQHSSHPALFPLVFIFTKTFHYSRYSFPLSTIPHNSTPHNTILHNSTPHNTILNNTTPHNTTIFRTQHLIHKTHHHITPFSNTPHKPPTTYQNHTIHPQPTTQPHPKSTLPHRFHTVVPHGSGHADSLGTDPESNPARLDPLVQRPKRNLR